jgi:hypothetical protein
MSWMRWLVAAPLLGACAPPPGGFWAAEGTCLVEGTIDSGWIEVRAEGAEPFSVGLRAPSWVRLTLAAGGSARAQARTPHLELEGGGAGLPLQTALPLEALGGLVRLAAGVAVTAARLEGAAVLVSAQPGLHRAVAGVPVDCAALALGVAGEEPSALPMDQEEPPARHGVARQLPLSVHLLPDDPRAVALSDLEPEYLSLELGPPAHGWRLARWQSGGASVRGWVRESDVRETETFSVGGRGGSVCCAGLIEGTIESRVLPAGTPILAGPGAGAWARVHTPVPVQTARQPGSRFARVLDLPDVRHRCLEDSWIALP